MFQIRRSFALIVAAIGLGIGVPAIASTPAAAAVPPFLPMASIQFGSGGVVLSIAYPDMAACEIVALTTCYQFVDRTVIGQFNPFAFLNPYLGILRIASAGGCTTIANLGGGSPYVDEIYTEAPLPLVVVPGSCADLAREVANHEFSVTVPFVAQAITPSIVSVENLSTAIPAHVPAHRAGS